MKNIISVVTFFLLIQSILIGQWEEKYIATGETLTSVSFLNDDIGYVSTVLGVVYKTVDGGEHWDISFEASGTVFLEDIFVINENTVIAVGANIENQETFMVKTENGGENWAIISISSTALLNSVFFVDNQIGYSCGGAGKIFKTIDGGETWTAQISTTTALLQSVFFVDKDIGFVVGGTPSSALVLKTIDGGNTWNEIDTPSSDFLQSVFMLDSQVGFTVGWNGTVLKTENGGDLWINQVSAEMSGNLEVFFVNNSTGYIVGGEVPQGGAVIQRTNNGGGEWESIELAIPEALIGVFFPSFNIGYAIGSGGVFLKTTSGGISANEMVKSPSKMTCFPNPVSDYLTIKSNNNEIIETFSLYDNTAKLILSKTINHSTIELDFTNLVPGNYYLLITSEGKKIAKKILKF